MDLFGDIINRTLNCTTVSRFIIRPTEAFLYRHRFPVKTLNVKTGNCSAFPSNHTILVPTYNEFTA